MAKSKSLYAVSGIPGVTLGMHDAATAELSEDNDGVFDTPRDYIIDLSHLLSLQLGKQMSQMATYRVKGFQVHLRNEDDANDNDYGINLGGTFNWYAPTKQRIDAMQHTREWMKERGFEGIEDSTTSPFGFMPSSKKYKGLRFNWSSDADDVESPTGDGISVISGDELSMFEVFNHYNIAIGGSPQDEGYEYGGSSGAHSGRALWNQRCGSNVISQEGLYWAASYRNKTVQDIGSVLNPAGVDWLFDPMQDGYQFQLDSGLHLPVLGGLIRMRVNHSNTANPRAAHVDDDYLLQLTILVEGWEGF